MFMGIKRFRNEYTRTNNRRTFHIIHIKYETGCCLACSRRKSRKWFKNVLNGNNISWKLVAKNKKQWNQKKISANLKKYLIF